VFVDIEKSTHTIDPSKIKKVITKKTKAIIPVHLFGQPADMDYLLEIAQKYDLKIVEDCAQALGGRYKSKKLGSFGDVGCFSFQESKNITTGGEGGMVVTNNKKLEEKLRIIMHEGEIFSDGQSTSKIGNGKLPINYIQKGYNFRFSAIQAAIGLAQLKKLPDFLNQRNYVAVFYNKKLKKIKELSLPKTRKNCFHAFNNYALEFVAQKIPRDFILQALNAEGIPAYTYYPTPLNETDFFKQKNIEFKTAKQFCFNQLLLPIYPALSKKELLKIVEGIWKVFSFVR